MLRSDAGWFTSLSSRFLACKTAKLLILAGADRLDKELMIGQMQGKFQQEVFTDAGHCLQEVSLVVYIAVQELMRVVGCSEQDCRDVAGFLSQE